MIYVIELNGRLLADMGYFDTKYDAWDQLFDELGPHPEYSVVEIPSSKELANV